MEVLDLYSLQGEKTGSVTIPTEVVNFKPSKDAVYHALKGYQHNRAQRTASVKNRAAVAGGGAKPWRQKGTGRARAGTSSSPVWTGGGMAFGPHPTDPTYKVNRKIRQMALKSALYYRISDKKVLVLESLIDPEGERVAKTRNVVAVLKALELEGKKVLLLIEEMDEILWKSARNIRSVSLRTIKQVNAYDIVRNRYIVTSKKCLESIKEIF